MSLMEKVTNDILTAMKSKNEFKLGVLRMVKSELYSKHKQNPKINETQEQSILQTMIKQRKDSIDQFTKGNRLELAEKESLEIPIIEHYLPREATLEEINDSVDETIRSMKTAGLTPAGSDFGSIMKSIQSYFKAQNVRVDGKILSEEIKKQLA